MIPNVAYEWRKIYIRLLSLRNGYCRQGKEKGCLVLIILKPISRSMRAGDTDRLDIGFILQPMNTVFSNVFFIYSKHVVSIFACSGFDTQGSVMNEV